MKITKVGMVTQEVEGQRIRVQFWQTGGLLLIEVHKKLFTVAQMFPDTYLRFFDVSSETGEFGPLDLNQQKILFTVPSLAHHRKGEKASLLADDQIAPSTAPLERYFIYLLDSVDGGFPWRGGNLVDMDGIQGDGGWNAPVVKANLDAKTDRDTILCTELTNMWTYEDLIARLLRYFETGVNVDQLKYKAFPDLAPIGPLTDSLR